MLQTILNRFLVSSLMLFHALTVLPFVVAFLVNKFQQPVTIHQIIDQKEHNKRTVWKKALKPELKQSMSSIFRYIHHIIVRFTIWIELIDFIILTLWLLIIWRVRASDISYRSFWLGQVFTWLEVIQSDKRSFTLHLKCSSIQNS